MFIPMIKQSMKFFLCGVAFAAFIPAAYAETLNEAVEYAIQNHPSIHSLKASEGAARETVKEERSAYYPTVNLGANFGRAYSNTTTTRGLSVSRGVGYSWVGEGNGRLNQLVYDWSATKNAIDAAKSRHGIAQWTTQTQEMNIALSSMQAYLQLLRASTLLGKAKSNASEMDDFYKRIKTSYDNGGVDESVVSRAQALVSLSKNLILQYESELQIAQASYKESVGRLPEEEVEEPSIDLSVIPETIDGAVELAQTLNSQMRSAELTTQASQYDLKREEANALPLFDFELSGYKKDQKDLIGGEAEDVRGVVRANWDYSFGGSGQAAQRRAAYVVKESEFNKDAMKRAIQRDVEVSWVSLSLARQQKLNEQDRLQAAQKTLETYEEQYEGGQQKMLDVMTVLNGVFLAEQDYLNVKFQEMNAAYTLMNVIGLPFFHGQDLGMANAK